MKVTIKMVEQILAQQKRRMVATEGTMNGKILYEITGWSHAYTLDGIIWQLGLNTDDQFVTVQRSDDEAVDRFAIAMKRKLATARAKGRTGWDNPGACTVQHLANMLVEHLTKGNTGTFEDIANFAMMLHQRQAEPTILTEAVIGQQFTHAEPGAEVAPLDKANQQSIRNHYLAGYDEGHSRGLCCGRLYNSDEQMISHRHASANAYEDSQISR